MGAATLQARKAFKQRTNIVGRAGAGVLNDHVVIHVPAALAVIAADFICDVVFDRNGVRILGNDDPRCHDAARAASVVAVAHVAIGLQDRVVANGQIVGFAYRDAVNVSVIDCLMVLLSLSKTMIL